MSDRFCDCFFEIDPSKTMFHNLFRRKNMKKIVVILVMLSLGACSVHLPQSDPVNQHLGDSAMRLGRLEKTVDGFAQNTAQRIGQLEQAVVELQRRAQSQQPVE
jgi:hypothetical protein